MKLAQSQVILVSSQKKGGIVDIVFGVIVIVAFTLAGTMIAEHYNQDHPDECTRESQEYYRRKGGDTDES